MKEPIQSVSIKTLNVNHVKVLCTYFAIDPGKAHKTNEIVFKRSNLCKHNRNRYAYVYYVVCSIREFHILDTYMIG